MSFFFAVSRQGNIPPFTMSKFKSCACLVMIYMISCCGAAPLDDSRNSSPGKFNLLGKGCDRFLFFRGGGGGGGGNGRHCSKWLSRVQVVSAALSDLKVAGSIPTIGDSHTGSPCKKRVFACHVRPPTLNKIPLVQHMIWVSCCRRQKGRWPSQPLNAKRVGSKLNRLPK